MDEIVHRMGMRLNVDVKLWISVYKKIRGDDKTLYWVAGWMTGIPLVDRRTRVKVPDTKEYTTLPEAILTAFDSAIEEYEKYYNAYANVKK